MTPEETIQRGRAAENLLSNTLLNEAFEEILKKISLDWLGTKREGRIDTDTREELHARGHAIAELRAELWAMMNDAIAETAKIERADKRQGVK